MIESYVDSSCAKRDIDGGYLSTKPISMRPSSVRNLRKAHRILGVILGVQFMAWTVSGLYFSWSDLDCIHGDPWLQESNPVAWKLSALRLPVDSSNAFLLGQSLELRTLLGEPYWWIGDEVLVHAQTGRTHGPITSDEAMGIVHQRLAPGLEIASVDMLTTTGPHHEYRERPLPAWQVQLQDGTNLYVDAKSGELTRVRNTAWRVFDALWMFHTMDYATRDNFNNLLLRVFSLAGLVTVLSGLLLFGATWRPRWKSN
jgi:uncharacterized iron-regulated membrane protein